MLLRSYLLILLEQELFAFFMSFFTILFYFIFLLLFNNVCFPLILGNL